jgi:hypothetical protein
MADTTFIEHITKIEAEWLNDVNQSVYRAKDLSGLNVINVKSPAYGALGNGATEDTAAFQAAANVGGSIYIPDGTYIIGHISITKSCVWFGDGDLTILKRKANLDTNSPTATNASCFSLESHNITNKFYDLLMDGNEANQIVEAYGYLLRYTNVAGTASSRLSLIVDNVTFKDATQCCIWADGDTATAGYEELKVINSRFVNGRFGLAQGDPSVVSPSGYGPDYITLTDKVYATIIGNTFIFTNTLANANFSRTAIRITFNVNTDNSDGARALIDGNFFYGCGRGERGNSYSVTGGTGTGAKFSVETLSGSGIATALVVEAGRNYTVADVLTVGGLTGTVTVATINGFGGVVTFTVSAAGSGYTATQRPDNDVGIIDAYARGREMRITNNLFEACQGVPIRGKTSCDLVYIAGNVMEDCGKNPGVNIGPNSYAEQVGKIIITGNHVRQSAGFGIAVVGNSGATTSGPSNTLNYVSDIHITNNIVDTVDGWCLQLNPTFGEGIYCRSYKNLTISHNTVNGTAYRGIYLRGITSGTPYYSDNLTVTDNRISNSRATGITAEASLKGIAIIRGNSVNVAYQQGYDIQSISSEVSTLIYSNNSAIDTLTYGHYSRFWDSVICTGNYVETVGSSGRGFYMQDAGVAKLHSNVVGAGVATPLFGGGSSQNTVHDFGNSWNAKVMYGTAAPTTQAWTVGDIVYQTVPVAAGNIGWVCTTAGTPGTWKTFGAIAA